MSITMYGHREYAQPLGTGLAAIAMYSDGPGAEPGEGVLSLIDAQSDNAALVVTPEVLDEIGAAIAEFAVVLRRQRAAAAS